MTVPFVVLAAVVLVLAPKRFRAPATVVCLGAAIHPLVGVAVGTTWWAVVRSKKLGAQRNASRRQRDDTVLALELVAMGLSAGVSLDAAVAEAATHVGADVGDRLTAELRRARFGVEPHEIDPICEAIRMAIDSESTGAPPGDQISQRTHSLRSEMDAELDRRLQRLPVAMLFPLALLILPGFLLVAVAPALIGGITRLGL